MSGRKPFSKSQYKLRTSRLRQIRKSEVFMIASSLCAMDPWRSLGYDRKRLTDFLGDPNSSCHRYLIICSGQTAAGVICVRHPWLRGPYIELLAVLGEFKGKGIGTDIVGWLSRQTGAKDKNIWALVSSFNGAARKFYKKQGFNEVAKLPDFAKAGFHEILIRKILR
jgi:ribosomal protein S18 acetylase RimI-like enzyme